MHKEGETVIIKCTLVDYKHRTISPSQMWFINEEERQEFMLVYLKQNESAMTELTELWDNHPSEMWEDEFIEKLSRDTGNEKIQELYRKYLSGEIVYLYSKKNMELGTDLIELINNVLPKGSTILEFGSGRGTQKLSETFNMLSVEESSNWVDRYDSEYLHAEIKDDWYDVDKVNEFIKNKTYDAIVIDGPADGNRNKIIELISSGKLKIDTNVYIFVDDYEREDGHEIIEQIKDASNKEFNVKPMTYVIKQGNTSITIPYFEPKENTDD